jgi:hypothetical protein
MTFGLHKIKAQTTVLQYFSERKPFDPRNYLLLDSPSLTTSKLNNCSGLLNHPGSGISLNPSNAAVPIMDS